MIENGLVYAVNKSLEKQRKREENSQTLCELFQKYNVNYMEKFSIKNWTKKDILLLHKIAEYPMSYITLNDNDKVKFDYNNNIIKA